MGWQEDYGAPQGYLEPGQGQPGRDQSWHPQAYGPDAPWRGYGRADSSFWLQGQPRPAREDGLPAVPRSRLAENPPQPPSWPSRFPPPPPGKKDPADWQAGIAVLLIFVGLFSGVGAWWLHTERAERAGAAVRPMAVALNQSARIRTDAAAAECAARKASGDLYVRTTEPGRQAQVREIGGQWGWDSTAGQCLSSLAFTIATAGKAGGECTTVGYTATNRGYNPRARPAAPLRDLAGEAGPGC
jgi:hypothetical protein